MSVWFECRLFDLRRFESLRDDLEALIAGEVRPSVRALAREGLHKLATPNAYYETPSDSDGEPLRALAEGPAVIADRRAVPSVNPLLMTAFMVDYERLRFEHDAPATRNLVQLSDGDGNLFAELINRSRFIDALFDRESPWWPRGLPAMEPPDYEECQHRALMLLTRELLARLDDELARLAADPKWLVELSWDRVDPVRAAEAFARLRDLVTRARQDVRLTVVIEVNG